MQPKPDTDATWGTRQAPISEAGGTQSSDSAEPDIAFWVGACIGTALAGGIFGLFLEGVAGFFFGTTFAAIFSVPFQITAGIVSWALWLARYRIAIAVLAGALTGTSATILTLPTSWQNSIRGLAILAGVLGALGAGIITSWLTFKTDVGQTIHARTKSRKWQFSLGSLFAHFAVICVLVALWTLTVGTILDAREISRIQEEQIMRQRQSSPD